MLFLKKYKYNDNNLAICYYRFSSHAQNEASIDQQREQAKFFAQTHDLKIIKEYSDEAISGTTDNRPGFQQMLSEVAKLKPSTLIVWKVDRLGRDRTNIAIAKDTLRRAGCRVKYVAETVANEDTPESQFTEAMLESMAEFYSAQLRVNVMRGMRYNAEHALYNGHKTLGYAVDGEKHYVIDEETAPVVRRIFEQYASGVPMQQIMNELNDAGIKTTRGNEFTINSLRHILHNRAYIGEYHYNDIVIPDGMPSIIPCELFKTAQERFELNRRIKCHKSSTMAKNVSESRFWLTGKLYCGKCGESMHGLSGTSKTGATHYYYACNNHRKHKCTLKNIPQHQMELNVISILKTFLNDSENLASLAVDIANYHKSRNDNSAFIASLEEILKQNEKQITNIVNAIANGAMSSALTDKLQQLEIEKGSLTDAIEVEQAKARLIVDEHSVKEYFKQYANANLDDAEIRDSVLNYFVDKIYVYDDKITVTGCFSGEPTEIPFTEFSEFDCETVSSTRKVPYLRHFLNFVLHFVTYFMSY